MIIGAILTLSIVIIVAFIVNLFNIEGKKDNSIYMKVQLPGNLPIITLFNNKKALNFLIDSGSNISHICIEYIEDIKVNAIAESKNAKTSGLNSIVDGITLCNTKLKDIFNNEYNINLSISDVLIKTMNNIEENTGVKIHGILGTDFLQKYNCVLDFEQLKICKNG